MNAMRSTMAMMMFLLSPFAHAQADASTPAPAPAAAKTLRVLFVGNSLVYTNNLPGLLRSFARVQPDGPRIDTETYVSPGADLSEHWKRGAAQKAIESGAWDVLVLQERGGLLACLDTMAQKQESTCVNSVRAHRRYAELAKNKGIRVVLLGTWGPDAEWQQHLDRGLRQIARETDATPVFAGTRLRAYQSAHRDARVFTDDSLHPSLSASLIVAAVLYREIAGRPAQAHPLPLDFPLLPPGSRMGDNVPLERNEALNALARPVTLSEKELPELLQAADAAP